MATVTLSNEAKDQTFRSYSSKQAADYAKARFEYPPALINFILNHHRETGGKTGVLLDVGCGPGKATQSLAPHFGVAFAADPGEAMITTAKELGGTTATGAPIEYRVCSAEEISTIPELEHGSVDLITAATAAHWFEMPKFWEAAAKLLKPGGSVAIWTLYGTHRDAANPNAEKVQKVWEDFSNVVLAPYWAPGNRLAYSGYKGMEMPWDHVATASLFEKETFLQREFDPSDQSSESKEMFQGLVGPRSLKDVETRLETMSPVTRWREAHPDLVRTDKDCVKVVLAKFREAMGVPDDQEGSITIPGNFAYVLLCVKRAA